MRRVGGSERPPLLGQKSGDTIRISLPAYDFNGRGRFVRRVHDEASGQYGNDTRNDLWHVTSGTYAGLVDPLDSGFVLARFGCDVGSGDPACDIADMNGDGLVDPLDVGFILARFGTCE